MTELISDEPVSKLVSWPALLEIKAVSELNDVFRAIVHNYLRATGHRLGMLANFGSHPKLEHERIIR